MESLGRLSKKAGVLATIVLDRPSGAILNTTGNISLVRTSSTKNTSSALNASDEASGGSEDIRGVEQMAAMVWNFVNATGALVQGLDPEVSGSFRPLQFDTERSTRMKSSCYDYGQRTMSSLSCQIPNTCSLFFMRHLLRKLYLDHLWH